MIAHGIILSGLTQLISQVKQITSIIFLLPFTSAVHRATLLRPHLSVIFPPKQQKHSRQLPFSLHMGSLDPHCSSAAEVCGLCALGYDALHHTPWDAAQVLGLLEDLPLGNLPAQSMQERSWSMLHLYKFPFCQPVPPPPADDGICARRPSRVLGPAPAVLWQCRSFFPSQQRELPRTSPDVTLPQIKKQKKKFKNSLFSVKPLDFCSNCRCSMKDSVWQLSPFLMGALVLWRTSLMTPDL